MIKVLQVNKMFHPWIGGVETVVKQIADELGTDNKYSVTVLAGNENPSKEDSMYTYNNYTVYKSSSYGIKFSTPLSKTYVALFKKLVKEHDVIHFHVPNPLGELSSYLTYIPANKKVVVTFHADVAKTRWSFFYKPYSVLLKKLLKRADNIIVTAPNNLQYMQVLKPYANKTSVVPLAIDVIDDSVVTPQSIGAFKNEFHLEKNKILLFVGRFSYYKGLDVLLKAMVGINAKLVVVGQGKLEESYKQLIEQLSIQDKIIFTGFLSREKLITAFASCDVFVLPSVTEAEAFGIVQLEAMYFKKPVINTNLPTGVPFVSVHNETGLTVKPESVTELHEAIAQLINNDELRNKLGENAKERVGKFSTAAMVDAYKKIYTL